jgi:hypothetical protein
MDVTVEEMEKRVARCGKVKPYEQTFIESRFPGFENRQAFHANRERLKGERLAREAAGTQFAAKKAKPKKTGK